MSARPHTPPSDRPEFPEYREQFKEDPARFLCAVDEICDMSHDLYMPLTRIRSIRDPDLLAAYLDVETQLPEGPRQEILAAIHRRKCALEAEGSEDE